MASANGRPGYPMPYYYGRPSMPQPLFGAIALSPATFWSDPARCWAYSHGASTRQEAELLALRACGQVDAEVVVWGKGCTLALVMGVDHDNLAQKYAGGCGRNLAKARQIAERSLRNS